MKVATKNIHPKRRIVNYWQHWVCMQGNIALRKNERKTMLNSNLRKTNIGQIENMA